MRIFKLPDLGEGLPDAEIAEWHVKVGDLVKLDQNLVSMETAKALVEIPSPIAGKVLRLYGQVGDIIKTGDPLVEFAVDGALSNANNMHDVNDAPTVAGKLESSNMIMTEENITRNVNNAGSSIKATPAIRDLAKRLHVDITKVKATGPQGTLTAKDIEEEARALPGKVESLKGIRRAMAMTMRESHADIVPVTVMDDAKLRYWSKETYDITIRLIQAIIEAVHVEPAVNAHFDGKNLTRRVFNEVNLGLAMDTEDGLFVPVIRNAEKLSTAELRSQVNDLKKAVKERSIQPQAMQGATIILSNFGKFAGRYANPIIVPPMVAILGVGSLREDVVAIEGKPAVCPILPLSISVDHRAVTGGEATRFLEIVLKSLEKA